MSFDLFSIEHILALLDITHLLKHVLNWRRKLCRIAESMQTSILQDTILKLIICMPVELMLAQAQELMALPIDSSVFESYNRTIKIIFLELKPFICICMPCL
ncbi:hypothetical protein TNCT_320251 [Trichonephila clavata]|uniref:Uncharacterized protein n=1 Tax=Trichonephila clavata TaxID=2740835 RepID=A0A8X6G0S7_TRICU|nr:hypothetical protein TNCT_320251 [Trichonephila clavata]